MRTFLLLLALIATQFAIVRPLDAMGVPTLVTGAVLVAVLVVLYRWIGRRPYELSGPWVRETGRGALYGFGLFTGILLIVAAFGMYHLDGYGSFAGMLNWIGFAAMAGVFEEMVVRGILFRVLEKRLGTWSAVGLSALGFGLLHIFNPGATVVSALAIAIEAGVMLALAYVATRKLWVPIGLHVAWNFTQGGLYGLPVSGISTPGLLDSHLSGPAIFSGGAFGIEGSLITVLASLVVSWLFYRKARRDGQIRPRRTEATETVIETTR